MASYEIVKHELINFVKRSTLNEGSLLALYGKWGTGKTHLCNEVISATNNPTNNTWCKNFINFLYHSIKNFKRVSLITWNNKHRLCELTYKDFRSEQKNISKNIYASAFGLNSIDALKRIICFGSQNHNTFKISNSIINKQVGVNKHTLGISGDILTTYAFSKIINQVIFIDDIERTNIDLQDLLGLISILKEKQKCKIILIANEKEISDPIYKTYKEKIIDNTIILNPTAQETTDILFANLNDNYSKIIEKYCHQLQISNLRTIKKIIYRSELLKEYLQEIPSIYIDKIEDLTLSHLVYYSYKHDYPEQKTKSTNPYKSKENEPEKDSSKSELINLRDLNPANIDFPARKPITEQIISLIESGYIDKLKMQKTLQHTIEYIENESKSEKFHSAWENKFHGSFNNDDDVVLSEIYIAALENISNLSLRDMENIINLLEKYDEYHGKIKYLLSKYGKQIKSQEKLLEDIRLDQIFPTVENETLNLYLKKLANKVNKDNISKVSIDTIIQEMRTGGWSIKQEEYLSELTIDDFYNYLKNTQGEDLKHAGKVLGQFLHLMGLNERQTKIKSNYTNALIKIGRETPLNEQRLLKYGIKLPEENN